MVQKSQDICIKITVPRLIKLGVQKIISQSSAKLKQILSGNILEIKPQDLTANDDGKTVKFMYQGTVVGIYEIIINDDDQVYLQALSSINLLRSPYKKSRNFEHHTGYYEQSTKLFVQDGIDTVKTKFRGIGEYMLTHLIQKIQKIGLKKIVFEITPKSKKFYIKVLKRLQEQGKIRYYQIQKRRISVGFNDYTATSFFIII